MDRLISEKSVMEVIYGCDWFIDEEHAEVIKERIKAIPSTEPYKGMTNGEVIKTIFPNASIEEKKYFDGLKEGYIVCFGTKYPYREVKFNADWWNSPYDPQEGANE